MTSFSTDNFRECNFCIFCQVGLIWMRRIQYRFGNGLVPPVASFTKNINPRLAKRLLKISGRLANRGLPSLVKEATGN